MNWQARPQRLGSDEREIPQSVHKERAGAGLFSAWLILGSSGPTPGERLVEESTLTSSATRIIPDCLTLRTNCKGLFAR
ncbi:MAG: hypothetical protein RL145_2272 [Pseudomonadota bacterium]|jgi:hypothetical protein